LLSESEFTEFLNLLNCKGLRTGHYRKGLDYDQLVWYFFSTHTASLANKARRHQEDGGLLRNMELLALRPAQLPRPLLKEGGTPLTPLKRGELFPENSGVKKSTFSSLTA
jgi:hypothetical protein